MSRLVFTLVLLACAADRARAQGPIIDARLGAALLTSSRSKAIGHLVKPELLLGARLPLRPRLEVGLALPALLDDSEHYRVLGLLAHARYALLETGRFTLGASAALGAGYDADILHDDLRAPRTIAPYGYLAADARWSIGRQLVLGVEAGWQNLRMFALDAKVGWWW